MIKTLRIAIVTALLLAAGNVAALGLGQIEVKSRLNQPLLAEIPIISSVPGELEAVQARLASPETFRRIGLPPPSGLAADLQFSLGSDARGRPVIRVITTAPVNQAVLNFLIEVDWGQGRLVREYSALVETPRTAGAAVLPAVSAPVAAAPNVVQRSAPIAAAPIVAAPVAAPAPLPSAVAALPSPEPVPVTVPAPVTEPPSAPEPAPVSTTIEPLPPTPATPAPAAQAPVAPATGVAGLAAPVPVSPAATPAQYGPVKRGETLSKIASQLPLPTGYTLDQTMLALLRANPDAFLGEDVNQLKQGAVLRVPGGTEIGGVSADEAALVVREQMNEWRQARRAVAQPDAEPAAATRSPDVAISTPAAQRAVTPIEPKQAARRQPTQARLAIVPPSAPGKATGTRSGTNAGGEGTMLQQQLQQRDEDLAARKAEIGELKERVAELETLQTQQRQLLAMKDSELAAAQQRLADTRKAEAAASAALPATGAAQAQATAQAAQADAPATASNAMPWIWGSLALLGLALLAWLLTRRSTRSAVTPRRAFGSEALAASMVPQMHGGTVATAADRGFAAGAPSAGTPTPGKSAAVADPPDAVINLDHVPSTPASGVDTPAWHAKRPVQAASPDAASLNSSFAQADQTATAAPQASATQRLKLAAAFQDMGDDHSSQQLLRELLEDADLAVRFEAARLLRELG